MSIFYEMGGVQFKPRAYEHASLGVMALGEEVVDIYKTGGRKALEKIPGVGPSIADHLEAIIRKGTFTEYERLRKKFPMNLEELGSIEGIGPKTILILWKKLKIKNLDDLERAARAGKLEKLPRFNKKMAEKISRGTELFKKNIGRHLLGEMLPLAKRIEEKLRKIPGVKHVTTAGSLRRWQETIGDLDFLVTSSNPKAMINAFVNLPEVASVGSRGLTKTTVRLHGDIQSDVRVLPDEIYGAALQYFTGDKQHNVEVRKIAIKKGYKLSEYGLFHGAKLIAGKTEEEIYKKLGMECPPPEIRTASGEIEAALAGKLPKLISYDSIKGDLQVQTSATDGEASIEVMAAAAQKAGLEYIAITDHTKSLAITGGLDEKKLTVQGKKIDTLNKQLAVSGKRFAILKSAEVNILKDGLLDIADSALAKLDVVSVAVHSHFSMTEREMTERILRAIKHPLVNILFHPTGRLIGGREPFKIDMMKLLRAAKQYGVAMEVNAHPERLDLKDSVIRDAVKLGVKLVVDSDAHRPEHFEYLNLGVAQVRRGWGGVKDVLNTKPVGEFLNSLRVLKK